MTICFNGNAEKKRGGFDAVTGIAAQLGKKGARETEKEWKNKNREILKFIVIESKKSLYI